MGCLKTENTVSYIMASEQRFFALVDVSVIVPAFNEAAALKRNIKSIKKALEPIAESCEIIIAEDGSTDGTSMIAEQLAEECPEVFHLHSDERLGKGGALKRALKISRGEIIIFMDADLATSLDSLSSVILVIKNGYDGAVASRRIKGAKVKRPFSRALASKAYSLFVRLLFKDGIRDHQCGFKAFSRQLLESVLDDVESEGFLFDTELIVKAQRRGFVVVEVPVTWKEPKGRTSKVMLFRDGAKMGFELLKLRGKLWRS
jgi:glycosyltransferase involved in cell wall biosynthesis